MPTATGRVSSGLTLRVVVIGLITLFFNFRWMIEVEAMRESPRAYFIYIVPLVNVVFILFVFSLLKLLNGKFAPQLKLASSELMALYVILSLSSSYCTHALLQILLSIMGHAYWFATPENEWEQLMLSDCRILYKKGLICYIRPICIYWEGSPTFPLARPFYFLYQKEIFLRPDGIS